MERAICDVSQPSVARHELVLQRDGRAYARIIWCKMRLVGPPFSGVADGKHERNVYRSIPARSAMKRPTLRVHVRNGIFPAFRDFVATVRGEGACFISPWVSPERSGPA